MYAVRANGKLRHVRCRVWSSDCFERIRVHDVGVAQTSMPHCTLSPSSLSNSIAIVDSPIEDHHFGEKIMIGKWNFDGAGIPLLMYFLNLFPARAWANIKTASQPMKDLDLDGNQKL